jgi:hypothetical protein
MSATNLEPLPAWVQPALNDDLLLCTGVEIAKGDLLYFDLLGNLSGTPTKTAVVKPISQILDQGSAAATQDLAAQWFVGVSVKRNLANDLSPQAALHAAVEAIDSVFEYPCVPQTWEIGDFVGPVYTAGAFPLNDQLLTKVANAALALGRVVRRYPVATSKVKCSLVSRLLSMWLGPCNLASNLAGVDILGQYASPPAAVVVPVTGGTITPPGYSTSMLVNPGAPVTGMILAPGATDGVRLSIINQSGSSITFAAAGTSNVADGVSCVISGNRVMYFEWSQTLALWFHS